MSCKPQKLLDYFVPLTIFSYMDQVCGKIGRLTIGLTLYCFPPTPEFDTSLFLSLFNKLCLNVLSAPMLLGARFRDVPWIPDNHPRSDCFFHANKLELRGILWNRNLRPRPRPSLFQNKFLGDFPSAKKSIGFVST